MRFLTIVAASFMVAIPACGGSEDGPNPHILKVNETAFGTYITTDYTTAKQAATLCDEVGNATIESKLGYDLVTCP